MSVAPRKLILASASPRRAQLLQEAGLCFCVLPSDVEEDDGGSGTPPSAMVLGNATRKATAISRLHPDALVIGADTTVVLDGCIFNKPADYEEARGMLGRLSGRTHAVLTGVCLSWREGGLDESFVEQSKVQFRALGEREIDEYLRVVDPMDKAGAYGIQEGKEMILASLDGSFSNVMGLPMESLLLRLDRCGVVDALRNEEPTPGRGGP